MVNTIPAAWRTELDTGFPPADRIYSDFRLIEYPDLETGSATYTLAREDNLFDRGNCESTTSPMPQGETVPVLANATWARSNEQKKGGDYSFKGTLTNGAVDLYIYLQDAVTTTDMHDFVAGQTYEYSLHTYLPSGQTLGIGDLHFQIYEYYGAAWHNLTDTTLTSTDTFEEISGTFTLNADATGTIIRWYVLAGSGASAEYFYMDDIRFTSHAVPGSHYLSGGYIETLCAMPDTFTLQIKFKPTFAYNTASYYRLSGWLDHQWTKIHATITWNAATDKFYIEWKDGGTVRYLDSAQYDDGTTHRNINQWITMTYAFNPPGGQTGSALWMNKTLDDDDWGGAPDSVSSEFNKFAIRGLTGGVGDEMPCDIAYVRLFPNLVATDAQVQNDFKDVENEEIFWCMDGHGTGRTRCNITRFIRSIGTTKNVENPTNGAQGANRVTFTLNNTAGEFSDDQYASFTPESDQFNGTTDQKYLQKRSNITIENWYSGDFDTVFFGKLGSGKYQRQTANDKFGVVYCAAEDSVGVIARKTVVKGDYWEDADLVDTADESDSLLHLTTRLATKQPIKNYLPDASFDSTAPTNSWAESSTDVDIVRSASYGLFGSNSGQITYTAPGTVGATITFTGTKKLSVGEKWTFYGWLQSTAAASDTDNRIYISENDTGGSNDLTAEAYTLTAASTDEDWKKAEVTHTISSSDSDRLVCYISGSTGDIIRTDGFHLIQNERALHYFIPNDNEGSAGVESADDADSDSYDTVGFDVEDVAITHPWCRVEANEGLWEYDQKLGDATIASYIGFNSAGTFRFRSRLSSDYGDPVPMDTIDESQGLSVQLETQDVNTVIVHGVRVHKEAALRIMWDGAGSGIWDTNLYGSLNQSVSTDETWPSTSDYGNEFVARYGDADIAEVGGDWEGYPSMINDGMWETPHEKIEKEPWK